MHNNLQSGNADENCGVVHETRYWRQVSAILEAKHIFKFMEFM